MASQREIEKPIRVLVFEPDFSGHRLTYVKHLANALCGLPVQTILALSQESQGSDEFAAQMSGLPHQVIIDTSTEMPRRGSVLQQARMKYHTLQQSIARHRPNHLYVPYADGLSQVIGASRWQMRTVWPKDLWAEGLLMRGAYAYERAASFSARLQRRLTLMAHRSAPWQTLFHIDPLIYEYLRQYGGALQRRLRLLPDPIEPLPAMTKEEARGFLGIPRDGRYVLISGRLDERKGADLLIRAFARANLGASDRLLLAGRLDSGVRVVLTDVGSHLVRQGRIVVLDRYLRDEQIGAANLAADLVCVPYPHHIGSASLLLRAVAAERRVLGSDFGWIAWAIETFGLGAACNVREIDTFAMALKSNLAASVSYAHIASAKQFAAFHSTRNFQATWTKDLRLRLNVADDSCLEWSQVVGSQQVN